MITKKKSITLVNDPISSQYSVGTSSTATSHTINLILCLSTTFQMATDIRTSSLKSPIDVAEYLFTRLHQIGVRSIHGVPGDYNLVALDYIDKVGLRWVGNVNELNAGKC